MIHCKSCGAPYGADHLRTCAYCGTLKPQSLHSLFDANSAALESMRRQFDTMLERERRYDPWMSAVPSYGMSAMAVGSFGSKRRWGWW